MVLRCLVTMFTGLACSSSDAPNLVLITLDTTRIDALGVYGGRGGHSPNIDRLGASGVVFENAIAPMGTTYPSHATLFTGLLPRHHGVRSNADSLARSLPTLATRLASGGYHTAAFVALPSLLTRAGFDRGFVTSSDERTGRGTAEIRAGDEVNRLALDWIETAPEPFSCGSTTSSHMRPTG